MTNNNEKEIMKLLTRSIKGIESLREDVSGIKKSISKLEAGQAKLEKNQNEMR